MLTVFLADESRMELQCKTQQWKTRLSEYGLRLNTKKTEHLEAGPQNDGTISINGEYLAKVSHFKYLRSMISNDDDILPNVRPNAPWMKLRQVTGVLCDRRMPDILKSKIYKSVVRPVALYGSECWPATSKHEQDLHTVEMRMVPGPDTMGPCHEHQHPKAAGHCADHGEDATSVSAMVWARGQK